MKTTMFVAKVAVFALAVIAMMGASTATPFSPATASSSMNSRHKFAASLFGTISRENRHRNVVFSPASIQTSLALTYLGAEGKTAEELHAGLKFGSSDKNEVITNYGEFINRTFRATSKNESDVQLNMANRIYVSNQMELVNDFNDMAHKYFQSAVEVTDFSDPVNTVSNINKWVSDKTNKRINNLLQSNAVNSDTNILLINAIYFKAKWLHQFSQGSTKTSQFSVNSDRTVDMQFMYDNDFFNYADLDDLNAKVLEMPYVNSNLSMLLILPNEIDGLDRLESQLADYDLNHIVSKVSRTKVDVFVPKFHIEFDVDLKEPLKKMGMPSMFSSANLSGLVNSSVPQKVSEVRHRAYLDVNEAGSEAAATTFLKLVPMSLNFDQKEFKANHPFVFVIRCPEAVYFAGHVVGL